MSFPFNYPTPVNADVQIFAGANRTGTLPVQTWEKPQGVSFVWFTLIGAGGAGGPGDGTNTGGGGGSGAVTNCLVPAFLIPDNLFIQTGDGISSADTTVSHRTKNSVYTLLTASCGNAGTAGGNGAGGGATTSSTLGCAGLYQSITGQTGGAGSASITTFLSSGTGTDTSVAGGGSANYGYNVTAQVNTKIDGYFQFQPIIVGRGGSNSGGIGIANAGFGCGGSGMRSINTTNFGYGGPGLVVIISW